MRHPSPSALVALRALRRDPWPTAPPIPIPSQSRLGEAYSALERQSREDTRESYQLAPIPRATAAIEPQSGGNREAIEPRSLQVDLSPIPSPIVAPDASQAVREGSSGIDLVQSHPVAIESPPIPLPRHRSPVLADPSPVLSLPPAGEEKGGVSVAPPAAHEHESAADLEPLPPAPPALSGKLVACSGRWLLVGWLFQLDGWHYLAAWNRRGWEEGVKPQYVLRFREGDRRVWRAGYSYWSRQSKKSLEERSEVAKVPWKPGQLTDWGVDRRHWDNPPLGLGYRFFAQIKKAVIACPQCGVVNTIEPRRKFTLAQGWFCPECRQGFQLGIVAWPLAVTRKEKSNPYPPPPDSTLTLEEAAAGNQVQGLDGRLGWTALRDQPVNRLYGPCQCHPKIPRWHLRWLEGFRKAKWGWTAPLPLPEPDRRS